MWPIILAVLLGFVLGAQAEEILLVQRWGQRDSALLVDLLEAQGHDVTVLDTDGGDTVDTAANYAAAGYDLLIVDEVISSGQVGAQFATSPIPVLSMEAYLLRSPRTFFSSATTGGGNYADVAEADAANGGAGANYGQIMGETQITITDAGHPLAAGLPAGNVQLWNTSIDTNRFVIPSENPGGRYQGVATFVGTANLVAGITKVAEVPGGPNYWTLWVAEPGLTLSNGSTNQARWVHLPWNDTLDGRVMQEPSFFLFEAAAAYAMGKAQPTKIRDLTDSMVFAPTNTTISFSVDQTTAGGSAVAESGIGLTVNGVDVSGDLAIVDGGTTWDVTYDGGFEADEVYTIVASATAADGGTSARKTTLDTLDPDYFTVEAEDYNFTTNDVSGLFIDNPVLCAVWGGSPDCYYDRVSLEDVDRNKGNADLTVDTPLQLEVYRWGSDITPVREETMDTYVSFDFAVSSRVERVAAGVDDYEVRNIGQNDWQNYTRTYPTGTFNVYLRMLSSGPAGTVELGMVDDPVSNTTVTAMGTFVPGGIGPRLVPLTDAGGNAKVVVELTETDPSTLRLTQLGGGANMQGYFVLVPSEEEVNEPPTVSIDSPADRAVIFEGQVTAIEATAADTDGTISKVEFFTNGVLFAEDATAPYSADLTPPSLGAISTFYTVEVVATDDGSLTASDAIAVEAVDPSYTFLDTAVGNGADAELRERDDPPDAGSNGVSMNVRFSNDDRNEIIGLRFDLTGVDRAAMTDVSLALVEYRNNSARPLAIYGVDVDATATSGGNTVTTWQETNVVFSTMPGLAWDGDPTTRGIDAGQTTLLYQDITNPGGSEGIKAHWGGPVLTDFVKAYTGDEIVFLIAQDPDEIQTGQFRVASKEADALTTIPGTEGEFAPFLAYRVEAPEITIDSFSLAGGGQASLTWSGGTGPYTVQTNAPIDGSWDDEQTGIAGTSATVTVDSPEMYYRVLDPSP